MPFNGSGSFVPLSSPTFPAVPNTVIVASYFNATMADVFLGFGNCVTRDGQSPATANLPMGGFKHQNAAAAAIAGEYLTYGQSGSFADLTLTGNLSVEGNTTLGNASTDALTINSAAASTPNGLRLTGADANSYGMVVQTALGVGTSGLGANAALVNAGTQSHLRSNWYFATGADRAAQAGYSPYINLNFTTGVTEFIRTTSVAVNAAIVSAVSMTIDASGNVGIGAVPVQKLTVNGRISYSGAIGEGTDTTLDSTSTTIRLAPSATWQNLQLLTAGSVRLAINNTGAVTIGGNLSAGNFLIGNVEGTVGFTGANGPGIEIYGTASATPNILAFRTSNAERMRISAAGNVGFGNSITAQSAVEVVGGAATTILSRGTVSTSYAGFRVYNDLNVANRSLEMDYTGSAFAGALLAAGPSGEQGALFTTGAFPLVFGVNGTARMLIATTGTVNLLNGSNSLLMGGAITRFDSGSLTCPAAGNTTTSTNHGGPRVPDLFMAVFRCVTAEHGWAIGQEIVPATVGGTTGYQLSANATQITLQIFGVGPAVYSTTFTYLSLTPANWKLVFRAIWL